MGESDMKMEPSVVRYRYDRCETLETEISITYTFKMDATVSTRMLGIVGESHVYGDLEKNLVESIREWAGYDA